MKLINLAGCSELVHAEWILPDLTLSWITFPFRWLLSLSLSLPLHTPLNPYTYTHNPPTPCWGSKWSKITHSATQSLLHLALGTDCFISWLFSPLSLLCSLLYLIGPVFFFLFPYHRNSTKTRARDVELLDLSHCVVCVDLVRPHTSGMCFFLFWTPLLGRNRTCYVHHKLSHWHRPVLELFTLAAMMQKKKKQSFSLLSKSWHSINQAKRLSLRHNFTVQNVFYSFHKIHLESSILNKIKLKYLRDSV